MAKHGKPSKPLTGRMSAVQVQQMVFHAQSGAAGIHRDQFAKKSGSLRPNRQNTRQAAKRAAIQDS